MKFEQSSCHDLIDLIWTNDAALKLIYDRRAGTIKRYNVEALLFQLFSVGVLHFSQVTKHGSGIVILTREKASIHQLNVERYKMRDVYTSINTLAEETKRKYPYDTVLHSPLLN